RPASRSPGGGRRHADRNPRVHRGGRVTPHHPPGRAPLRAEAPRGRHGDGRADAAGRLRAAPDGRGGEARRRGGGGGAGRGRAGRGGRGGTGGRGRARREQGRRGEGERGKGKKGGGGGVARGGGGGAGR